MRRGGRTLAALAGLAVILAGCGGSSSRGDDATARGANSTTRPTDERGNPLPAGIDWSATGKALVSTTAPRGSVDASGGGGSATTIGPDTCVIPTTQATTTPVSQPPGVDEENPFGKPKNDFPLNVDVHPTQGDRGTVVTVDVTAVGAPQALAVMVAGFRDNNDHGMYSVKFTDLAGRVQFRGPVPKGAPLGQATLTVTVTRSDNSSAIETRKFIVTGPNCHP